MTIEINGDTGISGVNGSATTPAIQGTDTNTGLTFGTDTVGVVTGGSTRATVDSSGRLLINTASARSNFYNTSLTALQQIEDTTSPRIAVISSSDVGGRGGQILLAHQRSATIGGNTILTDGDVIGTVSFQASDGAEFVEGARVEAQVDGTPGSNDMPGRLVFSTTSDGFADRDERMRITSGGDVKIGTTSLNGARLIVGGGNQIGLWVRNTSTDDAIRVDGNQGGSSGSAVYVMPLRFGNTTVRGGIYWNGSTVAYLTTSDYRLKENIVPLTGAVDRLNQLQVRRFNFIENPDLTVDGFIAHEAQAVVPEAVTGTQDEVEVWKEGEELPDGVSVGDNKLDEDGNTIPVYQGIDQAKLVPLLTAALQEALAKIETLETRLTALEGGTN